MTRFRSCLLIEGALCFESFTAKNYNIPTSSGFSSACPENHFNNAPISNSHFFFSLTAHVRLLFHRKSMINDFHVYFTKFCCVVYIVNKGLQYKSNKTTTKKKSLEIKAWNAFIHFFSETLTETNPNVFVIESGKIPAVCFRIYQKAFDSNPKYVSHTFNIILSIKILTKCASDMWSCKAQSLYLIVSIRFKYSSKYVCKNSFLYSFHLCISNRLCKIYWGILCFQSSTFDPKMFKFFVSVLPRNE